MRFIRIWLMEQYNPDYVLILSGDHIYKMDYEVMLDFHKANKADITIACMPVPIEEASRFGIMVTDESNRITEFEEKPEHPKSNLASKGIYIFDCKQQSCFYGYLYFLMAGSEGSVDCAERSERM